MKEIITAMLIAIIASTIGLISGFYISRMLYQRDLQEAEALVREAREVVNRAKRLCLEGNPI